MQTKRKIISIVTSTVVSTLLVVAAVYATSTIGDDITVGDDLIVTDALTVTGKAKVGTAAGATGIALDGTDPDQAFQTHAVISAAVASGAYAGNYTTNTINAAQTNDVSVFGSWSELYLGTSGSLTLGGSNYGAIWGNLEVTGTVNIGASNAVTPTYSGALIATIIAPSTMTVPDYRQLAGIVVDSNLIASYSTGTGATVSGILIRKSSGKDAWPVGLRISDSTTAIATLGTGVDAFGSISTTETSATPGDLDASFKLTHTNNAALTGGRLSAMSINLEPKAGVDAYKVVGGEVCTYLAPTVTVSGPVHGLFVETQGGGTLGSDFYSLYVYAAPSAVPSGSSAVMRLENNATADNRLNSFIDFVGGKGNYAMTFGPLATQTAWAYTGTPTNASGWLKIKVGSADRWIQLYSTAP